MSFNFASFSLRRRKRKVVDIAGRKSVAGSGENGEKLRPTFSHPKYYIFL